MVGTAAAPLSGAYYGVTVIGWGTGKLGIGTQRHLDLTTGNAVATIMLK